MHHIDIQLQQAHEHRARQIAEAAEHRLGQAARVDAGGRSIRRNVGRSLIRLGRALAPEPEPLRQPARPR